jgi:hypothetical protein
MLGFNEVDYLKGKATLSFGIAVITATVLSYIRGGETNLVVTAIFLIAAFVVSLLLFWLFSAVTLRRVEAMFLRVPHSSAVRDFLAFAITVSLVFWTGPVIQSGGFGGWLLALLFCIVAPLVVCLLALRFVVAFGALASTCIELSVLLTYARSFNAHSTADYWQRFWQVDWRTWAGMLPFAVGLSFVVSLPIYIQRRRAQQITTANSHPRWRAADRG